MMDGSRHRWHTWNSNRLVSWVSFCRDMGTPTSLGFRGVALSIGYAPQFALVLWLALRGNTPIRAAPIRRPLHRICTGPYPSPLQAPFHNSRPHHAYWPESAEA